MDFFQFNYERKSEQAHIPHAQTLLDNAAHNMPCINYSDGLIE